MQSTKKNETVPAETEHTVTLTSTEPNLNFQQYHNRAKAECVSNVKQIRYHNNKKIWKIVKFKNYHNDHPHGLRISRDASLPLLRVRLSHRNQKVTMIVSSNYGFRCPPDYCFGGDVCTHCRSAILFTRAPLAALTF